jgi:hypothetical protein
MGVLGKWIESWNGDPELEKDGPEGRWTGIDGRDYAKIISLAKIL